MQKILGISSQELRQYQLLQYLFRVKRHHRIDDIRLYEDGVMNPRTFSKLENALHNFELACLNQDSIVVKKGGSDRWIATFNLSSTEWQICWEKTPQSKTFSCSTQRASSLAAAQND